MPQAYADVAGIDWYTSESSSPVTVFKPAAFGPGQILLLAIFQDTSGLSTLTAPSGWTQEENPSSQSGDCGKVWSHVYDGAEPSTWDFGYGSSDGAAVALIRIEHADVTSPAIVAAVPTMTSSNSSSMDSPTVTPTGNNDLLLCLVTCRCSGSTFSYTKPSGMTDRGLVQVPGGWTAIAVASEQLVAPGATGTRTWTGLSPTAQQSAALSIAIKDSGAFDPDPPRIPPLPTISEALLNALLANKAQRFVGNAGTPWIQEKLSGAAVSANVTLTTAAGTKAGDVLYCFHGNDWYTAAGLTTPTGTAGTWTLEATADGGLNTPHLKLWRRVVTVDGPQTVTVAPAVDEEIWSHVIVIGGADTTSPTDTAAGNTGTASTSHVAPSITPTSDYPLMLCAAQADLITATYTPPPGMDEITDLQAAGIGAGSVARQVLGVTNTATGTRTFTSTQSQPYATISVAIRAGTGVVTSPDVTVNAEQTTHDVATGDPGPAISVPDGTAPALAHTTADVSSTQTTTDGTAPALSHTSGDPSPALATTDSTAPALTHQAFDATVTTTSAVSVDAELTNHAVVAGDPTITQQIPADIANHAQIAGDATASVGAPASAGTTSHTAGDALGGVSPTDGTAPATSHTTATPAPALAVPAGDAATTHTAYDATVSTAVILNVNAPDLAHTITAGDPAVKLDSNAEQAATTHQTFDAVGSITTTVNAGAGATSHTSADPLAGVGAGPQTALHTFITQDVTSTQTTPPGAASNAHNAFDALVSTSTAPPAFIGVEGGSLWVTPDSGTTRVSSKDSGTTVSSLVD